MSLNCAGPGWSRLHAITWHGGHGWSWLGCSCGWMDILWSYESYDILSYFAATRSKLVELQRHLWILFALDEGENGTWSTAAPWCSRLHGGKAEDGLPWSTHVFLVGNPKNLSICVAMENHNSCNFWKWPKDKSMRMAKRNRWSYSSRIILDHRLFDDSQPQRHVWGCAGSVVNPNGTPELSSPNRET